MDRTSIQLTAEESEGLAALRHAMGTVSAPRKPVALRLARGSTPMESDDVLLVVLSRDGAVVHHRKLPENDRTLEAIRLMLCAAELAVDKVAAEAVAKSDLRLSRGEEQLLEKAGMARSSGDFPGAFERSRLDYEMLLRDSLTLSEAARRLHVGTSRLRQRLSPAARTLFGIKEGRSWRLPKFQFAQGGETVRGIQAVLPHVRPDAHPLAVQTWFTTPHQDLLPAGDERGVTPLEWLAAGHAPAIVASLAEEI
ncbi:MAG: hypothetical protein FD180_4023 [Planctomycetota bacterium]|nr:MAG: hypothetical protein FD180_4023 [Planctomycetota bacterium]